MPARIEPRPIQLTVGQARLAAKAKIDADNFRFQNIELRQAKIAQDTALALYVRQNGELKTTAVKNVKVITDQERRIRNQNRELWVYRSGILTFLLQRFIK